MRRRRSNSMWKNKIALHQDKVKENVRNVSMERKRSQMFQRFQKTALWYFGEVYLYQLSISFRVGQGLPNKIVIFGFTVLAVVIIIGGLTWTIFNPNQATVPPSGNSQTTQPPSNLPEGQNSGTPPEGSDSTVTNTSETTSSSVLPEEVRDAAMAYVKIKHSKTAQFMTDLSWTGSRFDSEELGNETYVYYADSGWTVTVQWLLVSNPVYDVSAELNSDENFILWQGTYQNGTIKETSYHQSP